MGQDNPPSNAESAHYSGSKTTAESQSISDSTIDRNDNTTIRTDAQTTREHIRAEIQTTPQTASELATIVNTARSAVFGHIQQLLHRFDQVHQAPPALFRLSKEHHREQELARRHGHH